MKKTLTFIFLIASLLAAKAQKTEIFKDQIMFHNPYLLNDSNIITKEAITYGKVTEVVDREKDGNHYCFINLEQKHYDNPMYLMAFENSYKGGSFDSLKTLVGKTIFVYGKVELQKEFDDKVHKIKPSIIIKNPDQIKIITDFK
jgi:hypothetical protein